MQARLARWMCGCMSCCVCWSARVRVACLSFVAIYVWFVYFFFFQAEDGIRDLTVTGVQTCALPIFTQAQRDLLQAQVNLLQTAFDYQSAVVRFEAVQQAPPARSSDTVAIRGANIVDRKSVV